jgi:hypothetical protein
VPSLFCSCPWPSCSCACAIFNDAAWADKFAERQRAQSVDHAGFEVKKHRAGHVLAALGLVAKFFGAVKLRVVVAAVLAVTADAVLVANCLPRLGAYLVIVLARLHVHYLARRDSL